MSKFKVGMARGVVVVDENLFGLENFLVQQNIRCILPDVSMVDEDIKYKLLPHRIFITNNANDFVDDAVAGEYGIISTENIRFKDFKMLSKMISRAIIEFELWSYQGGFILILNQNENHELKVLQG